MPEKLTADETIRMADFAYRLYRWGAGNADPADIPTLIKDYGDMEGLFARGMVKPTDIIRYAAQGSDSKGNEDFADDLVLIAGRAQEKLVREYQEHLPREILQAALEDFATHTAMMSKPNLKASFMSRQAIRNATEKILQGAIDAEKEIEAKGKDETISRYSDNATPIQAKLISASPSMPRLSGEDRNEILNAGRLLAAAITQKQGLEAGDRKILEMWLRQDKLCTLDPKAPVFMPVEEALDHMNKTLLDKGVGDSLRQEIMRTMRSVVREKGSRAGEDPPPFS